MAKQRQRHTRRDTTDLTDLRTGAYLRVSRADEEDRKKPSLEAERSTSTQRRIYQEWAARAGVRTVDEYADPDMSASRFAVGKNRPEFERMIGDVKAGKLDVLWFWELSRQQRRLDVFAMLRDLCRDMGVLWVVRDRVHDPADSSDMLMAGIQSMMSEQESEKLSVRVTDGKKSAAMKGKPAGQVPYGYKKVYNPMTESFERVADTWDGDGRAVEDSPAFVVREIFDRIRAGEPIYRIHRDLLERQAPAATHGNRWLHSSVRRIARRPAYAGLRVYHGEILDGVEGKWPPLVDLAAYWAVQDILTDPKRRMFRPGRGAHLLSSIATCGECGGKLVHRLRTKDGYRWYTCFNRGCASIGQDALDRFVTERIVTWLSDPGVAAELSSNNGDSAEARAARTDASRARAELEEWRTLAERGEVAAVSFARFERGALGRIADAERRVQESAMPAVVAGAVGPQARAGWDNLHVTVRRQLVKAVAEIRVHRVGSGQAGHGFVDPVYRVAWRWLLPGEGEWIEPLSWEDAKARQAVAATEAQHDYRRDRARALAVSAARRAHPQDWSRAGASPSRRAAIMAALLADPELSNYRIALQSGTQNLKTVQNVRRDLEQAGQISVIRRSGGRVVRVDGDSDSAGGGPQT